MSQRSRKRRTTSPVKKVRPTLSPARKQQCSSKTRRMLTRQSVNSNKKSKAAKLLVGKLSKTNLRIKRPIPLLLLPLAEDLLEPNPKALLKTHPKATLSSVVKSQHSLNRQREVKKRKSWKTSQNLVKPPPQFKLKIRYLNKLRVKWILLTSEISVLVVSNDAQYVKVKSQLREENTRKILRERVITKTQTTLNVTSANLKSQSKREKKFLSPSSLVQKRKCFKVVIR